MSRVTDIIGVVVGSIGVVSVLVAVFTYLNGVQKSYSESDIGYVCCNERRMGIFVAKTPWYYITPSAKAEIPSVPTFTGLLRAGDANIWTSALVDDLPDNLSDEVCWTQIYEHFFIELAGNRYSAPKGTGSAGLMKQAAKKNIQKRNQSKKHATNVENQTGTEIGWWRRPIKSIIPLSEPHLCYKLDRQDLYQPIHGQPAPLRRCIKPLEKFGMEGPSNPLKGNHSIWERNMRRIWILQSRPCLAVTMGQLAGLCLAFSIYLKRTATGGFSGTGACGLVIHATPYGGSSDIMRIQLAQIRRPARLQPSRGSGYSLLYAKLMACGCLPFAQTRSFTKSIVVTKDILRGIKKGRKIVDKRETEPNCASLEFLEDVPGQTNDDFYRVSSTEEPRSSYGAICDEKAEPLKAANAPAQHNSEPYWTWSKAVAGIAFGGLVPSAARNLVDCVRFTVLGAEKIQFGEESNRLMEAIERFINVVHGWNPELDLFGPFIARRLEMAKESNKQTIVTFFLGDKRDIPDVSTTFSRYTTLLERLVAMVNPAEDPVEEVYGRLCGMLQKSYQDALPTSINNGAEAPRLDESLEVINKYENGSKPTHLSPEFCAGVARVLILAWTYQVNIIQWEADNESRLGFDTYAKFNPTNPICPIPIKDLGDRMGALGL